jgi:hypothetical protein
MTDGGVYRGVVLESNATTGKVVVAIPAVAGANRLTVSTVGREPIKGRWKVPPVNSVVLLTAEDQDLTTLFLLPTYTHDKEILADNLFADVQGPIVVLAKNKQGSTIPKGTVVYDTVDNGQLAIGIADANDIGRMPALGITVEDIANNQIGKVAVAGPVTGINTAGLSVGADLYAATNGTLSNTPIGLTVPQVVARLINEGSSGSLLVTVYPVASSGESGGSVNVNGIFTGTIYASQGILGGITQGWTIDTNRLESFSTLSGQKIVLDGADGEIYIGGYGDGTYGGASTPFYVSRDGKFSLGNKVLWDGSTLDINGKITADEGEIAGWTINAGSLTSGSGTNYVALSSDSPYAVWAGANDGAFAPFQLRSDGAMVATSASISGSVQATSGSIGGWAIQDSKIQSFGGMTKIVLDGDTTGDDLTGANSKIYVGNNNWGNPANGFYVDDLGRFGLGDNLTWDPDDGPGGSGLLILNGQIDANQATFAGWSLEKGRFFAGTAGDYIELNAETALDTDSTRREYATWAGHPNPLLAPFAVRRDGYITRASTGGLNLLETTEVYGRLRVRSSTNGSMGLGVAVSPDEANNGLWINNSNYWYDDGKFRTGSSLNYVSWNGTDLEVSGRIIATSGSFNGSVTAQSGSIGGWQINTDSLTGTNVGLVPATYPFYAGGNNPALAPFRVAADGSVVATSGSIGGWTLSTTGLSGPGNVGMAPATFPFYAGGTSPSAALFRVNTGGSLFATNVSISGNITATSGTIGGWNVAPGGGSMTNGSSGMIPGSWPIFAGGTTASAAKFRVNDQGQMWATEANITGAINATSGTFSGSLNGASGTFSGNVSGGTIDIGGADSTSFHVDSAGNMWTGSATYASTTPFRVSSTGVMRFRGVETNFGTEGTITISPTDPTLNSGLPTIAFTGPVGLIQGTGTMYLKGVDILDLYAGNTRHLLRQSSAASLTYHELWAGGTLSLKLTSSLASTAVPLSVTGQVQATNFATASGNFSVPSNGNAVANSIFVGSGSADESAITSATAKVRFGTSVGMYWSGFGPAWQDNASTVRLFMMSGSSSERYKEQIAPVGAGLSPYKLLDVDVIQFKYKDEYSTYDSLRSNNLMPGLIAEEIHEKYPIACEYDREGIPRNWTDRIVLVGLLKLVQDLHARVTELESA